jgi:hypothetical protein
MKNNSVISSRLQYIDKVLRISFEFLAYIFVEITHANLFINSSMIRGVNNNNSYNNKFLLLRHNNAFQITPNKLSVQKKSKNTHWK